MEVSEPMMIDSFEILRSKMAKSIEYMFGCKVEHCIIQYKYRHPFTEYKFTCNVHTYRKQLMSIKNQFALTIGDIDSVNMGIMSGVYDYQIREYCIVLSPDEETEKKFTLLALEYLSVTLCS